MYRWTARIRCNEHELDESFSVLLFIGEVPDNPTCWRRSPTFVGDFAVYTGGYGDGAEEDHEVQGFVQLNDAMSKIPGLRSLKPGVVVPYLKANINWRVETVSGAVWKLHSLEVVVLATDLERGSGSNLPVPYNDITYGRTGGARSP